MGSGLAITHYDCYTPPAMARPLRLEFPGAVYHVTSRGNARQDMVADDRDRTAWRNRKGVGSLYCLRTSTGCGRVLSSHISIRVTPPPSIRIPSQRRLHPPRTAPHLGPDVAPRRTLLIKPEYPCRRSLHQPALARAIGACMELGL